MVFPSRGEENLTRPTSSCKNFQPNMFNKHKCQNCFRTREAHELDNDGNSNKPKKVILCGFLFVAPGLDPNNPASKMRKWQRRFFVFYETGELCYQLDDNPSTTPQGTVNMYQCTEVFNAKKLIDHDHSLGIVTPDDTLYIKAETREEKDSWYHLLKEYPILNQEAAKYKKKKNNQASSTTPKNSSSSSSSSSTSSSPPGSTVASTAPTTNSTSALEEKKLEENEKPPTTSTLGRISSFKENIQPHRGSSAADKKNETRLSSSLHLDSNRSSYLKESDHSNFRRTRSLREKRFSQRDLEEEEGGGSPTSSRQSPDEEKESRSRLSSSINRKSRAHHTRLARRHTSPVEKEDIPDETLPKLKTEGRGSRGYGRPSESGVADLENELEDSDNFTSFKSDLGPEFIESSLHRNNNNVYKTEETTSSSQVSRGKSNLEDTGVEKSRSSSFTESSKPNSHTKKPEKSEQSSLTDEELLRLDVPKRLRTRIHKGLTDGETQSPSKRTIEKRRHAQVRRSRHTMDGSIQLIPVLDSDMEVVQSRQESPSRLKRSSSDPNLADIEDAVQRREIEKTFPGLYHLKNGWLSLKEETDDDKDWVKRWFVLRDNKLSFYFDAKDDLSSIEGSLDLSDSEEAILLDLAKNYAFKIKMKKGEDLLLAALTSGIRNNWVGAINKAILTARKETQSLPSTPLTDNRIEENIIAEMTQEVEQAPNEVLNNIRGSVDDYVDVTNCSNGTEEELRMRAPSQRIRDRKACRSSYGEEIKAINQVIENSKRDSLNRLSSDSSDVFFDAVTSLERRQPEGRNESPVKVLPDVQGTVTDGQEASPELLVKQIKDELEKCKAKLEKYEQENAELHAKNACLLDNVNDEELENEKVTMNAQLDQLLKKNSQLDHQVERLHMELRQTRNSSELLSHKNEELLNKVDTKAEELEKKNQDYQNLQSRFEKLVQDLQESEVQQIKDRTSVKAEREKTVDMIERLNERINSLESDNCELQKQLKRMESSLELKSREYQELEEKFALAATEDEYLVIEEKATESVSRMEDEMTDLREKLVISDRERTGILAQLQGAKASLDMIKKNLKEEKTVAEETVSKERALKEEIHNLETELEEVRVELFQKDDELEKLKEGFSDELNKRAELQDKYDILRVESTKLSIEEEEDIAREEEAISKVSALEVEISERRAKVYKMAAELQSEKKLRAKAEETLAQVQLEQENTQDELNEIIGAQKMEGDPSEKIQSLISEVSSLKGLMQNMEKENHQLLAQLAKLKEEKALEEEKLKKTVHDVMKKESEIYAKEEVLKILRGEIEKMRKENEHLFSQFDSASSECQAWKLKVEELQEERNVASMEDALSQQVESLQEELNQTRANSEAVRRTMEAEIVKKSQELETVSIQADDYQLQLQMMTDALKEKAGLVLKLQKEIESRQKSFEEIQVKVEKAEKEIKRLRNELKESQDCYDRLEIAHMQLQEHIKQHEGAHKNEVDLMGQRIQDLTSKLSSSEKKSHYIDDILREQEKGHRTNIEEMKSSYTCKIRSMEDDRRRDREKDSEALATAIQAVKRVYEEDIQQERQLLHAGKSKDVESMLRKHRDVVSQMNKDWLILSKKFSQQCRDNAQLSRTIGALQLSLEQTQEQIQKIHSGNQTTIDELAQDVAMLKQVLHVSEGGSGEAKGVEGGGENGGMAEVELDAEAIRMLKITLKLRDFQLRCAREEVDVFKKLNGSAPSEDGAKDSPAGGTHTVAGASASKQSVIHDQVSIL